MKQVILIFSALLFSISTYGQGRFYVVDASHSVLNFKARHIGFGSVRGQFEEYEGTIWFDPVYPDSLSASFSARVSSISTGNSGRDGILKEEFFQEEEFPLVIFQSRRVEKENGQQYLIGDLQMGAVKKEVRIPYTLIVGPKQDQFNHYRVVFEGSLTLNRKDYGLIYRSNDFWDGIVDGPIEIEIEVGASYYNSLETIFPFRDNSIGKILCTAAKTDGLETLGEVMDTVSAQPEKYNTSHAQNLRGATHAAQSGRLDLAIAILQVSLDRRDDLDELWRSEYQARLANYLWENGKIEEARKVTKTSLSNDPGNSLAMELLKKLKFQQ